ncbi:MAG: hypothetical protein J6R33_04810 [Clostridia bacterium]|nr:hypothetical protein [Clostridia bacterium]
MGIIGESFLGVNSESGFASFYRDFVDGRTRVFVIKGGPGTGKSTLMRKVAQGACEKGYDVELLHCSSDPDSLDAVYMAQTNTCILDGTPPHVVEPPLPGAVGRLVDLYQFWDHERLTAQAAQIKKTNQTIHNLYSRIYLYLGAAGRLQRDLTSIGATLLNRAKLRGYTDRLCARYIRSRIGTATEEKRFFSAFTPQGVTFYPPSGLGIERQLVLEDEYGILSRMLEVVRLRAIKANHRIISGYSPLMPDQLTQLILPDAGLMLCLSNSMHKMEAQPYCRIHVSRFLDTAIEEQHKAKLAFLRRSRDEILKEACDLLSACHKEHDCLEEFYKGTIDYAALDAYTQTLIAQILS